LDSKKIAREYISLVEDYFGPIFKLGPEEIDHIAIGEKYSNYKLLSNLISESIDDLTKDIKKFWDQNRIPLAQDLKNSNGMKCLYSGDLSPQDALQLTKKTALYVDTIMIPDPLYKISFQLSSLKQHADEYLPRILRHATNMYKLKDLLLADTEFPIVAIAPLGFEHFDDPLKKSFESSGEQKFTDYCKILFNYNFKNPLEVFQYLTHIDSSEKLFNSIVTKNNLPPDLRTLLQMESFLSEFTELYSKMDSNYKRLSPGQMFITYISTQSMRVVEHKLLCSEFGASPIYDHERSWFFLNQDLGAPNIDTGIIQGLQNENLKWLGNIPPVALRTLREQQELEDFRQILRRGLQDIKVQRDEKLTNTVNTLQYNLKNCLEVHNSRIEVLQNKVNKITHRDIPITTLSALIGCVPGGNLLSIPFTIKDLVQQANEVEVGTKEISRHESSFVNFLIKAKNGN
jgi:hypothetical protein